MNLNQYLDSTVFRYPNKIAVKYNDKSYTYTIFHQRVGMLANAMKSYGLKKGDSVGLICKNSNNYLETIFACAKLGIIAVNYNWRIVPKKLLVLVKESNVKMLFISSGNIEVLYCIKNHPECEASIVSIGEETLEGVLNYENLINGKSPICPSIDSDPDDTIFHFYTSGTTGKAKSVMLTNKNIITHFLINIFETNWDVDDRFLYALPLFHASSSGALNSILSGSTLVILDRFEVDEYLQTIEKEKITRLGLVPNLIDWILKSGNFNKYDLSSLKSIIYAGAPISLNTLKEAVNRFDCDFYQLYGMTEMSPVVSVLKPDEHIKIANSSNAKHVPVGKPTLGTNVKMIKQDGEACQTREVGELIVSSDTMMKGYHNDEAQTKKAIIEGWYHTGDIGFIDKDGYIYILDRKKNMIITGGENVYSSEVENCIRGMGTDIIDVAVVGLPDDRWGEIVAAIIIKDKNSHISRELIIDHCMMNMASYKKPKLIEFWEEMPRNRTGKLNKEKIKKICIENQLRKERILNE
ncbi:Acyl-CoA synthetase (AMP-forming)/AMP-acid ligase II [Dethiosulfatibacter aminovorans DSM 17477]|uniref:Acyl-CoA synthetase (AMP-forming)/AMP-acid ligase II n=1 Tax=Dethiosulfatibacter aminovorans DSM 17477 TaxID=1121476 RepID=A0A1M6EYN6_9FIRM|nr:AMP-binding protein [Dethiosulfatibacter aminovorans]SHI90526.1 Acyl-CoA synthetase (AMP-forming)/AMP-acid ligase II [Dethiosulfatibacter aminovorans DSM 17477]